MLACLPGPGDLSSPLLSYPQMNTGLRKWDTTQKMRAAQHPTPAELDAYAKKVANHPLTIKIFPNSVKVPQRKHVRRTVNGLDTSGQRYSPYPPSSSSSSASSSSSLPQAAPKTGLLAIVRPAAKGIVKDFDGTRSSSRLLAPSEAMMNPPPYAAPSTLSHHPQQAAAALARHQQQQQQQHLHAQSMAHAVLQPQLPPPQHPGNHLLPQQQQQPPPPPSSLHGGGRKMSDADAPPNVTVSTSTIPLSMAATLQQSQPPDLSSIVHQINQFCQARAGSSATSVCEGQIANPSPISRNLLISASTRVSAHSLPGPMPSCGVNPGGEHPAVPLGRAGPPAAYQSEMKQAAAAAAAWNHHQLTHLQQMCGGGGETMIGPAGLMGKPPVTREQGFGGKAPGGYPLELCMGQPFNVKPPLEKPTPSPPVNGLPYANGHYFPPLWNNILPTPNSDSSGSQDLAMPFHGTGGPQAMGAGAAAMECPAGPHYRAPPNGGNNNGGMPAMEYLSSGDFQHHPCLREPAPPPAGGMVLGKAGRSAMNWAPGDPPTAEAFIFSTQGIDKGRPSRLVLTNTC